MLLLFFNQILECVRRVILVTDSGVIVGASRGGSSISETTVHLGFSCMTVIRVYGDEQKTSSEWRLCGHIHKMEEARGE